MPYGLRILTQNGMASTDDFLPIRVIGRSRIQVNSGTGETSWNIPLNWSDAPTLPVCLGFYVKIPSGENSVGFGTDDNVYISSNPKPSFLNIKSNGWFSETTILTFIVLALKA